ncbi:helix-turn-helix transcriptional regulator [Paenibacillus sp. IB182496]|uniref:Helix-turn-helix transcriptional regulator n=1 Tax=Paenibacillus sabuli TaxID=2772509 RepID=A0A927GUU4_9BACL|nr:AraC family transcriptional regulator [Paenibacillus sabuli]MBD2848072.1 helix-turn-helix transcriptional regulator [Paenibacillus sabuli]
MQALQFAIPPLPQFLTIGHSVWRAGDVHFERRFEVYDMLFVAGGTLFMEEDGVQYAIGPRQLLVLEAGRTHRGYRPCKADTEIWWVHFAHPAGQATPVESDDVAWTAPLPQGTDADERAAIRSMVLPKYAGVDLGQLLPVLQRMRRLHLQMALEQALPLQALLAELLAQLQGQLAAAGGGARTRQISASAEAWLRDRLAAPLVAAELERDLQLNFDYIARCLRRHTGMRPQQYQLRLRIAEAMRLLAETDESLQRIAERVGMGDYNYFIRQFRRHTGQPPGAYRRARQRFA